MNEPASPDSAATPLSEQRGCRFPLSRDADSGEFGYCDYHLKSSGQGGRPTEYCGRTLLGDDGVHRKHDRITAFQRRRELERGTGTTRRDKTDERPVSAAARSFEDLLTRFEMVTSSHRDQLSEIVGEARRIVETASDPDAAVYEVAKITETSENQTRAAQAAATAAQHEAQVARRERDRAIEDKTLAEATAEDAIADRDTKVEAAHTERDAATTRAAEEVRQAQSDAAERIAAAAAGQADAESARDAALSQADTARGERDAAITQADNEIRQAHADAATQIGQTQKESDRRAAELTAATDQEIARIRAEAADQIAAATTAAALANSAREAAQADAATARAEAETYRTELSGERSQSAEVRSQLEDDIRSLRAELSEAHAETRRDREQLTARHAEEMASVRADAAARVEDLKSALEIISRGGAQS